MTTLYRPVLIETAEQAEALDEGTVAFSEFDFVRERCDSGWTGGDGNTLYTHTGMVGFIALVPIEAEEETRVTPEALAAAAGQMVARAEEVARTYALPPTPLTIQQQTRLVTPWEAS